MMGISYPEVPETGMLCEECDVVWADVEDHEECGINETLVIHDAKMADVAIRRISHLRAQRQYVNDVYNDEVSRLDAYKAKEEKRIGANEQYWLDRLEEYFHMLKETGVVGPRQKGFDLPHGRLQTWKGASKFDFSGVDPEVLAKIDPSLVREKKEVDVQYAKTQFASVQGKVFHVKSAQVVEGVEYIPAPVRFFVKGV